VLETIQRGLREAQGRLAAGETLFIHCAGGVHRTGFFTYALLRLEGLSRAGALDAIREMRLRTYQSCGQFRYELAEKLVQNMQNCAQIDISSANNAFQDCLQSEFVRGEEIPLLWIDMSLVSDQEIAISVNITNGLMTKVIEGPNFTSLIPNFSHQISSEWLQTHLKATSFPIPSKSVSESEAELMDFLESSAEPRTCKLASYYAYFDAEVLEEFFPRVYALLHYRVVDLSTFAVLSKEKIALEEPPIAFLRRMQGLLFEKTPREVQFERSS
jgi:oligoribonuclease (3'-5' exoribonuclease)